MPLAESGEGESEGEEQTDLELREAAEDDEDGVQPEEAQIDEAIEQAGEPLAGERSDPSPPTDSEWRTWSGRTVDS